MSITTDKLLIVQLTNFLNSHIDDIPLPCLITVDEAERTGTQLWIQPLAGTNKIKQYTSGSYIGLLPFAIYYQLTNHNGEMAQLDIPLYNIAKFLDTIQLNQVKSSDYTIVSIEMTSTPNAFRRSDDGTTVNQAIFQIKYYKE